MGTVRTAQQILWYASFAAQGLLSVYLLSTGLWRYYRLFAVYLLIALIRSAALFRLDFHTDTYALVWFWSELVILSLLALVVFEIYTASIKNYRTDYSEGAYILFAALLIAICFSFGGTLFDGHATGWKQLHHAVLVARRCVLTILLVFMLAVIWLFRRFPAPTSSNLRAHRRVTAIYLAQLAAAQLAMTANQPSWIVPVNTFGLGTSIVCFIAWGSLLRISGESLDKPVHVTAEQMSDLEASAAEYVNFMRSRAWRSGK